MSRPGRHESRGRHEPGRPLADQGWQLSSGRGVWRAYMHGLMLTVSCDADGGYLAEVDGPGMHEQAGFGTRLTARRWCERRAGARRDR